MSKIKNNFNNLMIGTRTMKQKYNLSNFDIEQTTAPCGDICLDYYLHGVEHKPENSCAAIQYSPTKNLGIMFCVYDEYQNIVFESNILQQIKEEHPTEILWPEYSLCNSDLHPTNNGFEQMYQKGEATKILRKVNQEVKTSYRI